MIPPTSRMNEFCALRCSHIARKKLHWRVLRDMVVCRGYSERTKSISSEQPRSAVDVQRHEMTAVARRVDGNDLDIAERTKDVWFEEIWVSVGSILAAISC